jgi:SAM-dependent methyltransferase
MTGVRYEMWADYIEKLLKRFGIPGTKLLDLGCGTGNTTFSMAERGFTVTGVDLSKEMLAVAHDKLAARPEIVSRVRLIQADMRSFETGEMYDVVTCLFDSINYVTDRAGLEKVFKRVREHLKPNGIWIFDVNTEYQLSKSDKFTPVLYEKGDDVALFWRDEWFGKERIWRIYLDGFVKDGGTYHRFKEVHEERAYSIDELEESLLRTGFHRVTIYSAYTFEPPRYDSGRLYFVCRT